MALRRLTRGRQLDRGGVSGAAPGGMHQPVEVAEELSPPGGQVRDPAVAALVGEVVAALLANEQDERQENKDKNGKADQQKADAQESEDTESEDAEPEDAKAPNRAPGSQQARGQQAGNQQAGNQQAGSQQAGGEEQADKSQGGAKPDQQDAWSPPEGKDRGRLEWAAGQVIAALQQTKQELAKEMETNLKQLKSVLQETQRIAKEMEAVLQEAKGEPKPEAYAQGGTGGQGGKPKSGWNPPTYKEEDQQTPSKQNKGSQEPPPWEPPQG